MLREKTDYNTGTQLNLAKNNSSVSLNDLFRYVLSNRKTYKRSTTVDI